MSRTADFTYDPTKWVDDTIPDLEYIRLRLADTIPSSLALTDTEIRAIQALHRTRDAALMECAQIVLAQLAKEVDQSGVGLSASRTERFRQLQGLIHELGSTRRAKPSASLPKVKGLVRGEGLK